MSWTGQQSTTAPRLRVCMVGGSRSSEHGGIFVVLLVFVHDRDL